MAATSNPFVVIPGPRNGDMFMGCFMSTLSTRHSLHDAIRCLCKEPGQFVADDLHLTEHEVPSGFEADEPRAGDALGGTLTRLVRGHLVVLGMDNQGWYVDRLQGVVVDIRVGDERVEIDTLGTDREHTVDEISHEPGVLTSHGEPFRKPRHQPDHRRWSERPHRPQRELPVE